MGAIHGTGVHSSNRGQVSMMQNGQLQRESALNAVKATNHFYQDFYLECRFSKTLKFQCRDIRHSQLRRVDVLEQASAVAFRES